MAPDYTKGSASAKNIGDIANSSKTDGLLVFVDHTWNLYFIFDSKAFDMEICFARIQGHPLSAKCMWEEKPTGQMKQTSTGYRWCPDDHLSSSNIGIQTTRNFSVLAGYTKQGDGKKGMTHAWMKMTKGRIGDERSLQIIGNWLCESCGYKHPFPQMFTVLDLDLRGGQFVGRWRPRPTPSKGSNTRT